MVPSEQVDAAIEQINLRLKQAHIRCSLERRREALFLRATLVDRNDPHLRRRQRIPLGLPADTTCLPAAEHQALELGLQLRAGTFSWDRWSPETAPSPPPAALSLEDFHTAARRLHASKYRDSPERGESAWSKKWAPALRKLPPSGGLTEDVLLSAITRLPEGSAGRRDQATILCQVARTLNLPIARLQAAGRGYGARQLTPRTIPSDDEIVAAFHRLPLPHWRWAWGTLATYGLRPHELIDLGERPDGTVLVAAATKTGARVVHPCPRAWPQQFNLGGLPRPPQRGPSLSRILCDALERAAITIRPYELRHAYAIRLMAHGVPPELGARLMGHSLSMHESTYKRWTTEFHLSRALAHYEL